MAEKFIVEKWQVFFEYKVRKERES